jgi:hypothetical protein
MQRRTLSKQSLQGQVIAKLTSEICISKVSSNSRLTEAGKQATTSDSHSQTCLQTLFFSFRSPYLWWDNNQTKPASWKTYWNCIAFELGTLCGFCFVMFWFILFFPFDETTTEQHLRHLPQDWRLRDEHQNCIWTWRFFFYFLLYLFFYFYFYIFFLIYLFFIFIFIFLFSILSLFLCLFSLRLISTVSLPVYIFETFLFVSLFVFFYLFICFSLFL